MYTAEQIAMKADHLMGRSNRALINKLFRLQDDSHLYPINNAFNATDRAIQRAQRYPYYLEGLEYAYFIENERTNIVNSY